MKNSEAVGDKTWLALALVDTYTNDLETLLKTDKDSDLSSISMQLPLVAVMLSLMVFALSPLINSTDSFVAFLKILALVTIFGLLFQVARESQRINSKLGRYQSAIIHYRAKFSELKREIIFGTISTELKIIDEHCSHIYSESLMMTVDPNESKISYTTSKG